MIHYQYTFYSETVYRIYVFPGFNKPTTTHFMILISQGIWRHMI